MSETTDPDAASVAIEDASYRKAVTELLAVIAYGELSAFERMMDDSKLAPTLADKLDLTRFAVKQHDNLLPLLDRITELGADPIATMQEFQQPLDEFHAHTAPRDWLEGLVKAYVGDGLANDFYREIAAYLDHDTRDLIISSLDQEGQADFVIEHVGRAIEADHRVAGRLALWGRRLMGEALSQAQRVAADRDSLTELLTGGTDRPGMDLAALSRLFTRLTENHGARMSSLGLDA